MYIYGNTCGKYNYFCCVLLIAYQESRTKDTHVISYCAYAYAQAYLSVRIMNLYINTKHC